MNNRYECAVWFGRLACAKLQGLRSGILQGNLLPQTNPRHGSILRKQAKSCFHPSLRNIDALQQRFERFETPTERCRRCLVPRRRRTPRRKSFLMKMILQQGATEDNAIGCHLHKRFPKPSWDVTTNKIKAANGSVTFPIYENAFFIALFR